MVGTEYIYVHTVAESQDDGRALARGLIEAGLAASVQVVGPVLTVRRYETALEEAQEWRLLITTTAGRLPALEKHIRESHTYRAAEIVATAITGGSSDYLSWVGERLAQTEVTP
jgi:periplasmic divalent cation tolerance protein